MNVFPTVYLAVYLFVFPTVFLAVFFVHVHTATVPSRLLRIRRRLRAVSASAPSPRGRYGKFVARQRKRRQIATFNQIRSQAARMNFEQRQPAATCTGAPLQKCHGNLGWQSFTR
jgi:hypothetical protein